MELRELKALELAARSRIVFTDGAWSVPSQSNGNSYRVTLKPELSCTCDDFGLIGPAGHVCKHIHAARLVQERDHGGQAPKMDTSAVPKRPTYKQNWPKYNEAQMSEKRRFQALLFDLCRGLQDPPKTKRGRCATPIADRVFSSALKVYTTFSSRRFACDLADAHEKGYLSELMNSVTICAYLESEALTPILQRLIVQSSLPLRAVEAQFSPDSSGFSTSRFVRWYDEKYGVQRSGKEWVKAHIMTGVTTNIVTAVEIHDKNAGDCPQFGPLLSTTAQNFKIDEVSADKAYLSNSNLEMVESLGGTAYVPFKSNSAEGEGVWARMYHFYQFRREEFLAHYHRRSNVESTFSMVKAKFRDHVRSKTDVAMKNEVLCKFLCHNICVVHQSHVELGIEPVFWAEEAQADNEPKNVLRFPV